MKSHIKDNYTEKVYTVDEDGVVIDEQVKVHKYIVEDKEQFFLGYVSLLSLFYTELSLAEIKIYSYLLQHYPTTNSFAVIKTIKEDISKVTSLKIGTIDNAMMLLVKNKLLYSVGRATYKINPRYAFKGNTTDRKKALKVMLELECPDC